MRIIRHSDENRIKGAMLIVLSILLVGILPIRAVFAESEAVSIPYKQVWTNKSGSTVDNSFEYRLTAVDGAPLPDEASGGSYRFTLTGDDSGSIELHFPFTKPGYYNYLVKAHIPDRNSDYTYGDQSYNVMIMVINGESGPEVGAMTIQDESLAKYAELTFITAYNKAPPAPPDEDGDEDEDRDDQGNGGTQTDAAPAAAPADTAGVIPDAGVPATIPEPEPPKSILPEPEDWALLNLILMILTVIIAFVDGIMYFSKPTDKYGDEYEDDEEVKRHGLPRILAIILAIVSVILFFLTEDMTDPMIWVDEYTLWMLILFIATAILLMMSKKETNPEEGEEAT